MPDQGLKELYIDELKDLYSAENQLVKALPKMAKAASSDELREGFETHLEQTRGHVQSLEKIFQTLGESPKGKTCKGMQGLIEEGSEATEENYEGSVMDAALIGAAQRVEHYEIAGYGTVRSMAKTLGAEDQVSLLEETFEEEKETDDKLTELAEQINTQANGSGNEQQSSRDKKEVQADSARLRHARFVLPVVSRHSESIFSLEPTVFWGQICPANSNRSSTPNFAGLKMPRQENLEWARKFHHRYKLSVEELQRSPDGSHNGTRLA